MLYSLASNDAGLADGVKGRLDEVVLEFPRLDVDNVRDVRFDLRDYGRMTRFLGITVSRTGMVDLEKLAAGYNRAVREAFREVVARVRDSHRPLFESWLDGLCGSIVASAAELNPELLSQRRGIGDVDERLAQVTTALELLDSCEDEMAELMAWRRA